MKQDYHVFQGMRQDNPEVRQDAKFLWEAFGVRLTNRDNNALLEITNERGNTSMLNFNNYLYIGHCIIGKYLVLFLKYTGGAAYPNISDPDSYGSSIIRIEKAKNAAGKEYYKSTTLVDKNKNLNFSVLHPLTTLGVFENELVQKVYWVDGVNQPRVINIMEPELYKELGITKTPYSDGCFDFIKTLQLKEQVDIKETEGNGTFAPGVIQYAFSYYNKYGQESNIFYTSELHYISFKERAGNPDESVSCIFNISLSNIDRNFQYLRIYSIHRTSLNDTATCKIVTDINIDSDDAYFVDTGNIGDVIDPTRLLYIGGEDIIANTITAKDNTLFLGNIKVNRPYISTEIKDYIRKNNNIVFGTRSITLEEISNGDSIYKWSNQLYNQDITTFKIGDYYRLGVQFQYKTGKWSEPIYINDIQIPRNNGNKALTPSIDNNVLTLNQMRYNLLPNVCSELIKNGYVKARGVIVYPSIYDRMVLAQGVLCPSVFSVKDRVSNVPFAQSSWFFRPMINDGLADSTNPYINDTDVNKGAVLAYRNLEALRPTSSFLDTTGTVNDRGGEIQNMRYYDFQSVNKLATSGTDINTFFVDQSIVTFHSPDIQFDDIIKNALNNNNFKLQIVGLVPIKSNVGDIDITTSSTTPSSDDTGFLHRSLINTDNSGRALVSGMFYNSHIISATTNADKFECYEEKSDDDSNRSIRSVSWMIYPWQRNGSLNNDCVRPTDKGTRTSVLKRKVISNLRFSEDNVWLNSVWSPTTGITKVSIFDSNEVSLTRIPAPANSGLKDLNYYGNIDTLITSTKSYGFALSYHKDWRSKVNKGDPFTITRDKMIGIPNEAYKYSLQLGYTSEPVRMKYKSTAHAVFALNYLQNGTPVALPNIKGEINKTINLGNTGTPFWVKNADSSAIVIDSYKELKLSNLFIGESSIEGIINSSNNIEAKREAIQEILKTKLKGEISLKDRSTYKYKIGDIVLVESVLNSSYSLSKTTYFDIYKAEGDNEDLEWYYVSPSNAYYKYTGSFQYSVLPTNTYLYRNNTTINGVSYQVLNILSQSSIYTVNQDTISNVQTGGAYLFLAELVRDSKPKNLFGGDAKNSSNGNTIDNSIKNNLWLPAGPAVNLKNNGNQVFFIYGDTFYQRFDCLKTYPFTSQDENSVIDIASFMCETKLNIDGRYDKNRGRSNNLNMSPTNFNLLNTIYSQQDNYFNYRILDNSFYVNNEFPTQVIWSTEKANLSNIDNWTNITLANSLDLDGSKGSLNSLQVFNDSLIAFQDRSISQILFNSRVQIPVSDGVPVEIGNNYKVDGTRTISDTIGCQFNTSLCKSPLGIYFIDSNTDSFYLYNGQINDIGNTCGGNWWLKNNHINGVYKMLHTENSIKLSYDPKYKDVYLSSSKEASLGNALCYSEQLQMFTSLLPYNCCVMEYFDNDSIAIKHTYNGVTYVYKNFVGNYNEFFGAIRLPYISYICNEDPTYTKIFDTLEYRMSVYDKNNNYLPNKTFDIIRAVTEYQDTGTRALTTKRNRITTDKTLMQDVSSRKKFKVWRCQIPRDSITNNRARLRDQWAKITLGFTRDNTAENNYFSIKVDDISTKYTV